MPLIPHAHAIISLQSLKAPELKDRLEESEKLIQEMTISWEEKLRKTEEIAQVKRFSLPDSLQLRQADWPSFDCEYALNCP